jgi:hypothetical protein
LYKLLAYDGNQRRVRLMMDDEERKRAMDP